MRFNKRNWNKYFDGGNKLTTIRLRRIRLGHHNAYAGSYHKPELLGEFDITRVDLTTYGKLTEEDARNDGFASLELLKEELRLLNGDLLPETPLFIHFTENVKRASNQ